MVEPHRVRRALNVITASTFLIFGSGGVPVAGQSMGYGTEFDFLTIKYEPSLERK